MTPAELRAWRLARDLTQSEAAALLGCEVRWLRYAESGRDKLGNPRDVVPPAIELAVLKCENPPR